MKLMENTKFLIWWDKMKVPGNNWTITNDIKYRNNEKPETFSLSLQSNFPPQVTGLVPKFTNFENFMNWLNKSNEIEKHKAEFLISKNIQIFVLTYNPPFGGFKLYKKCRTKPQQGGSIERGWRWMYSINPPNGALQ